MANESPVSVLAGIRVLELGHIVAGPSVGFILAELGAEVIKVEQPGQGDAARNMPNLGSTFYFLNRNKQSIAVDLKTLDGHQIFQRLMERSDIVVDNFGPGVLDQLQIGYEWAKTRNPGIIYASVKGFLPGPYGSRPFLDELAQMAGGLAYMTGPPGQPLRAGASIVDIGAATYGVVGILAALYQRTVTGRGQYLTAGLFETVVFWMGQHLTRSQLSDRPIEPLPARSMGGQMGWGVYRLFETADGREIFIAVTSDRHWQRFCQQLGLEDWLTDPSLASNRDRVAARDRIHPRIEAVIRGFPFAAIAQRLTAAQVPWAPVNTPADVLSDPHLNGSGRLIAVEVPEREELKAPTLPLDWDGASFSANMPPPYLGQHSQAILESLGYTGTEIEALQASGVIGVNGGMLRVDTERSSA